MSKVLRVLEHYEIETKVEAGLEKACCPLPAHTENTASFTVYEESDSWFCYGCGGTPENSKDKSYGYDAIGLVRHLEGGISFKKAVAKLEEILGEKVVISKEDTRAKRVEREEPPEVPLDVLKDFGAKTVYQQKEYRGITLDTDEYFKVRSKVDAKGNVLARYYFETNNDGCIVGAKCRNHPKDFSYGKFGVTGKNNQLFGQFKNTNGGKYLLIVGGEEDVLAAHQMFVTQQKTEGYTPPTVVSPTVGESSAKAQCKLQIEFIDQFDNIIIGLDNDDAGNKAMRELAEILPKEKVKLAKWTLNDPSEMLQAGREKQFLRDFYNSKDYVSTGIKTASQSLAQVKDFLTAPKITLPPQLHRLQDKMRGGIRSTGCIFNIIGDTSIGKCLGKDTPVLMSDNTVKPVQDIIVGDYLMGPDGTPRKVVSLAQGRETLYKVKQEHGMDYVVNKSHILSLRCNSLNLEDRGFFIGDVLNINIEEYLESYYKNREDFLGYKASFIDGVDTKIQIEDIGEGDYYGFTIDGDHLFCLGDGTVTHNTYFSDTLIYHWVFEEKLRPTIVSIERTSEEFVIDLLSLHLKKNLTWFKDGQDAVDYLENPEVQALYADLFQDEWGRERFFVVDERDGDLETLQNKMDIANKKFDSDLFIIDPLTDIVRSLGNEVQEDFMMWQKYKKKQGWKIGNVLHTRKPLPDKDGKLRKVTEYDTLGSGTFVQSADINMVLNRDKMAVEDQVRNTTVLDLPKCRGGTTGHACDLYYDANSRQQYDLEDYLNGITRPEQEQDGSEVF